MDIEELQKKLKNLSLRNDEFKKINPKTVLFYIMKHPDILFKKYQDGKFKENNIDEWENEKSKWVPSERDLLMNKQYKRMSEEEQVRVNKDILTHFKVNFKDPNNFIYVRNEKKLSDYFVSGKWDYKGLVKLYMKDFKTKIFECNGMKITSFPVYPNMIFCYLNHNKRDNSTYKLESFHIQPNMEVCNINYHNLKKFPVQPKMTHCELVSNNLESFPVQPNMTTCNVSKNYLKKFPIQPKAVSISVNDNQLTSFPIQPKMKYCFIMNNNLKSFPVQPRMEFLSINNFDIKNLPHQPKLKK